MGSTMKDLERLNVIFHICKLSTQCIEDFIAKTTEEFPKFKDPETCKAYASKWSENAECIICSDMNQNIVGLLCAYMNNSPLCYIAYVCILPINQRLDLFYAMELVLEAEAKRRNIKEIRVEVNSNHTSAILAYERCHYTSCGDLATKDRNMHKMLE